MLDFMREGGYAMWFILAVGGAALVNAGLYVRKPEDRRVAVLRTLSLSTIFVTLSGVVSGFAMTLHGVGENPDLGKDASRILMIGLAESLANAILGFTLLGLAWMIAAFGARRAD
ncbi:MAG TPA: hypothetical protein VL172_06500 [Kofleriaceae bacterium]|jgi:hypothetical protein|nr:hypothetical protein [Kofleriaceae bacterium]